MEGNTDRILHSRMGIYCSLPCVGYRGDREIGGRRMKDPDNCLKNAIIIVLGALIIGGLLALVLHNFLLLPLALHKVMSN